MVGSLRCCGCNVKLLLGVCILYEVKFGLGKGLETSNTNHSLGSRGMDNLCDLSTSQEPRGRRSDLVFRRRVLASSCLFYLGR